MSNTRKRTKKQKQKEQFEVAPEAQQSAIRRNGTRRKYTQPDLRVMVFKMAEHEYVVDAALVQEIIRPTTLAHMGGAPEYVEGVVKRRGRIVPIVDLRKRLGLRVDPPTVETCTIIANLPIGLVGFIVDSVSEMMRVKTHDFEVPSPLIAGIDQVYLQGVAHLGDRLFMMLDLELLLTPGEQQELSELGTVRLATSQPEVGAKPKPETLFSGQIDAEAVKAEQIQEQARTNLRRLMAFELGDELYGVSATDVSEIREPLPLMPLPNVPPHVLGLINLRGTVLPVVDLRRRFGLKLKPDGPDNRLIILKGPGYSVALWVDRVYGLARLPRADFQPAPPGVARIAPEYYEQVATLDGRMLIELNVQKLLADTASGTEGTRPEPPG